MKEWPRNAAGRVQECMEFDDVSDITFTSTGKGELNGDGGKWWGIPGIGYLRRQENRPRLIKISNSKNVVFEHMLLKDSPYWTFLAHMVEDLTVRYSSIDARRLPDDGHNIIDLTAFNTVR